MKLLLTETEIKELDAFIQDLPTKYGFPLLNYLNKKIQEQNQNQQPIEAEVQE